MRSLRSGLILFLSLVALSSEVHGQEAHSKRLLSTYDSILGLSNLGLVNGVAHSIAFVSRKTHPYYNSNSWEKGEIEMNTGIYPNVRVKYDAFQEALVLGVTRANGRLYAIQLRNHDIKGFKLAEAAFLRLENSGVGNGFFEVLYAGDKIQFLARRRKKDEIPAGSPTVEYVVENEYYFYRGKQLYRFRNKSSLFELMPERRDSIKIFIKDNKLKIKAQERQIGDVQQLIAYMDDL